MRNATSKLNVPPTLCLTPGGREDEIPWERDCMYLLTLKTRVQNHKHDPNNGTNIEKIDFNYRLNYSHVSARARLLTMKINKNWIIG